MIEVGDQRYITATEAPEHLGNDVTPEMVRDWGRRHLANRYPVGRQTYYRLDELIEVEYVLRTSRTGRPRRVA